MISRCSGALALLGGLARILKVALIWMNGGTEPTSGVVGILFLAGAVALVPSWCRSTRHCRRNKGVVSAWDQERVAEVSLLTCLLGGACPDC
jgi:hypothetical protein